VGEHNAVLHDSTDSGATNARIDERNRLAACMGREGIPTDDQHTLMLKRPEMHDGDVHFTTQGRAIQAAQVTAKIREVLGKSSKPWMLILTHNGGPRIVRAVIHSHLYV
jgi:hypothetical protein